MILSQYHPFPHFLQLSCLLESQYSHQECFRRASKVVEQVRHRCMPNEEYYKLEQVADLLLRAFFASNWVWGSISLIELSRSFLSCSQHLEQFTAARALRQSSRQVSCTSECPEACVGSNGQVFLASWCRSQFYAYSLVYAASVFACSHISCELKLISPRTL